MQTDNLELKKLVYLYLMNYAKSQPDMAIMAVNTFVKVRGEGSRAREPHAAAGRFSPPRASPLSCEAVALSCCVPHSKERELRQVSKASSFRSRGSLSSR